MRAYICERCGKVYDSEVAEHLENRCKKGGKLISIKVEKMPKDVITFDNLGDLWDANPST